MLQLVKLQEIISSLVDSQVLTDLALAHTEMINVPVVGLSVDVEAIVNVFCLFVGIPHSNFSGDVKIGEKDSDILLCQIVL